MQEKFIASYKKRGGKIEVLTFDGLPEHRVAPTPEKPDTIRLIEVMTDYIRRQGR
jgi:hypothetical protein